MPQNAFFSGTRNLLVSQKMMQRHLFVHPPSPFPGNFCNCNSGGICTALQFEVQLSCSNAYSEIGLEVTLGPVMTSCMKDYKGHSLVQSSFTELPNWLGFVVFESLGKMTSCLQHLENQWKMTKATQVFASFWILTSIKIWNRVRPRVPVQNQHTRELISA